MLFSDFIHKYYGLKNKAISNIKIQKILSSLYLNDEGVYLRDIQFEFDKRIVNLHPSERIHWIAFINQNYFDSYGYSPPQNLSKPILKRNGYCLYSECKIQGLTSKRDSYCAAYCLFIIYLTKVLGIDFKSAVLNLYYQ